ncbi:MULTISPECIES: hypothetical protein [unclassified Bradyrhizobium]|uniref:hypothetical protein n=1 Tax=unclassified Bradyrhizobium TaxID=2631580 RepID=UPI00230609DF|nr:MULTISPECIES: hypothetical protein [unclassified Bradyrhizobium]WFU74253.1 hypothetical protein QA642_09470 [Bradyrhizobium sp. CB2312]
MQQVSNSWIDVWKIEAERALFVGYNRALTNYYARAEGGAGPRPSAETGIGNGQGRLY